MVLTSSFGKLMEDQILQYYITVVNINDRVYILYGSVCDPGFHVLCMHQHETQCHS